MNLQGDHPLKQLGRQTKQCDLQAAIRQSGNRKLIVAFFLKNTFIEVFGDLYIFRRSTGFKNANQSTDN